jgi:aminocarboxymuconate-semialdehyde decarboxylase
MPKPLVIDVHAHHFGCDAPESKLHRRGPGLPRLTVDSAVAGRIMVGGGLFRNVRAALWNVQERLADMDAAGVDVQVISPVPVTMVYDGDPVLAADFARHHNDGISSAVALSGGRLLGLGTVPLQDVDAAVAELRCLRNDLGLQGVQIGTRVGGRELDDPALRPFFAAAEELDAAIFIHPVDGGGGAIRRTGWPYDFGLGMLSDTAMAATALVFGGVLEAFPALRIALAHGCGTFTWAYPRLRLGAQISGDADAGRFDALTRRLFVDSLVFDPEHLRLLAHRFGPDRVLLGSDHPFIPQQSSVGVQMLHDAVDHGILPAGSGDKVMEKNVLEFLGIRREALHFRRPEPLLAGAP